jgi:hypothetical protein
MILILNHDLFQNNQFNNFQKKKNRFFSAFSEVSDAALSLLLIDSLILISKQTSDLIVNVFSFRYMPKKLNFLMIIDFYYYIKMNRFMHLIYMIFEMVVNLLKEELLLFIMLRFVGLLFRNHMQLKCLVSCMEKFSV